ncbi:hypothetical protein [Deinococcus pimensis]|uniref:hypothetical protein n=1 Tax=Deinococcus pimensis TaxID=309888 RepID=UPI00146FB94B|nr:hypothetical protein [Deinococcus pimensis]
MITRGGRYTGVYESRNPDVAAVTIRTSEPVTLEDCSLRGNGHLITGTRVRLTVRRCHAQGLNPNVKGRAKGDFVHLTQPLDLRVENNDTQGVGGVTVRGFAGQSARGDGLRILRNRLRDIDGRRSDGQGGYLKSTGGDRGGEAVREVRNAVLFDHVQNISTAEIGWNEIVNRPWVSLVEDNINMYVTSGVAGAPILIHDNYVQGAYQLRPEAEAWFSGGGILVGDGVGSRAGENGWVRVVGNVVVSTTNYGVSVVGGVGSEVVGNRVVNSGRLPDGRVAAYANVGLVLWDYYKVGGRGVGWFGGNVVRGNVVAFSRVGRDGGVVSVPMFGHGCAVGGNRCEDNRDAGPATLAMERREHEMWLSRVRAVGIKLGAP